MIYGVGVNCQRACMCVFSMGGHADVRAIIEIVGSYVWSHYSTMRIAMLRGSQALDHDDNDVVQTQSPVLGRSSIMCYQNPIRRTNRVLMVYT